MASLADVFRIDQFESAFSFSFPRHVVELVGWDLVDDLCDDARALHLLVLEDLGDDLLVAQFDREGAHQLLVHLLDFHLEFLGVGPVLSAGINSRSTLLRCRLALLLKFGCQQSDLLLGGFLQLLLHLCLCCHGLSDEISSFLCLDLVFPELVDFIFLLF